MIMMNILINIDYHSIIPIIIHTFHFTSPIIVICYLGIALGINFGSPSRSLWAHCEGPLG